MDISQAILFGQLINAAYAIPPDNTNSAAGQIITVSAESYNVVASMFANDLATDMNPGRGNMRVSIGLILQSATGGNVVIVIRGIETGSASVTKALSTMQFPKPVSSLTICGHSLGGALATLLALDVAANTNYKDLAVYTYASPRTGGPQFAATYNDVVPETFRVAGRLDLVPKLPLPPLYDHVLGLYDLASVQLGIPPKVLVKPDLVCQHILPTYLHLLSQQGATSILPLNPECVP